MSSSRDNKSVLAPATYTPLNMHPKPRSLIDKVEKQNIKTIKLTANKTKQTKETKETTQFSKSMRKFLKEYDPYKLLSVEKTDDINTIKKAYKKLALKYHPDKGGNQQVFDKITKAYSYLKTVSSISNVKTPTYDQNELKKQSTVTDEPDDSVKKIYANRFNLNRFNQQFSENKLSDDSVDHGYGTLMTNDNRMADTDPSTANIQNPYQQHQQQPQKRYSKQTKFNLDTFNEEFKDDFALVTNTSLNPEIEHQEVQVYKEPVAFTSGAQGYSDIDKQRVSDYSSFNDPLSSSGQQQYTDYMGAYTTRTTFTNKLNDTDTRKSYKTVEELNRERANISYELSDQEKEQFAEQERKMVEAENERLRRIAEKDEIYEQHNKIVQQLFLNNE